MPLEIFRHSLTPHQRRPWPSGYTSYENYKPWLRDEFEFRCVYCLERETWYPDREASFSVDHISPQSQSPLLICVYENLLYACTRCNSARQDVSALDPTSTAFGLHLRLGEDASFEALTSEGQDLIELLHLNESPAIDVQRTYLEILELRQLQPEDERIERLFVACFGYPQSMPDLRKLRPPGGNKSKGSEATCFLARQEAGELEPTY